MYYYVINTLSSAKDSLSSFGHIIFLAKSTLDTNICISFSHVFRIGNKTIHNLTRHVRHIRGLSVWLENAPPTFTLYSSSILVNNISSFPS